MKFLLKKTKTLLPKHSKMVFSNIFGLDIKKNQKIKSEILSKKFSFIGISLGDRKFSFADIGIINFQNFRSLAVQNFSLRFLQKFKFR